MSHIVTVSMTLTDQDIPCLDSVAQKLGLEVRRHQDGTLKHKAHNYGRDMHDYHGADAAYKVGINAYGPAERVYGIPGNTTAYEVGLYRLADGTLKLAWDNWSDGFGLLQVIGQQGEKLLQEFGAQKAMACLQAEGFDIVQAVQREDGKLEIQATTRQSEPSFTDLL